MIKNFEQVLRDYLLVDLDSKLVKIQNLKKKSLDISVKWLEQQLVTVPQDKLDLLAEEKESLEAFFFFFF